VGVRTVDLVEYSDAWRLQFEATRTDLKRVLGDTALRIEHIGSTSVPGLVAKPTIDIAIAVPALQDVRRHDTELAELGFDFRGGFHDEHVMARRVVDGERTHHLHFRVYPSSEFDDWIRFRDILRTDPASRDEYAAEKRRLAARFYADRGAYGEAKTDVVMRILERASEQRSDLPAAPGARVRVVSTMTGAGYWWRGWCDSPGCNWTGPSRRGSFGGRDLAERDVRSHIEEAHAAPS
jgi:GrpB-like predicted nucleotidyltransferase (UPF0157 family)